MIRYVLVLALLGASFAPASARAASAVVLWPVDPVIEAGEQSAALWLENRGTEPVTLQVRSFAWTQANGEDHYERQDEVVTSPPIAEVAPGQRQLVRIVRREGTARPGQRAYRLLIDELPKPAAPDAAAAASARLAVQMRYSIPLFTYGRADEARAPKLQGRIVLDGGRRFVEIHNNGNLHARLTDLRLQGRGDPAMMLQGLVGYVLPGAVMRWPLPDAAPGGSILIGVNGTDQILGSTV